MRKKIKDNPSKGLSFLYNSHLGRIILKVIAFNSVLSKLVGVFMDSSLSKLIIKPFIAKNKIDMDDYELVKYKNFNDFFIREIKKEKRKIITSRNAFISPCDSKLTCYKINKDLTFKVKKSTYSVSSIINDDNLAKKYDDGLVMVFRLSPDDYHHYCFIDDGKITKHYKINGYFHTVNPVVYDKYEVFKENTRECTLLKTKNFGDIVEVEVGALLVGKIKNLKVNGNFTKGEEKGYFMFGGSTVVLIVKKDSVIIDKEIIKNSLSGFETYVKYGEKIGQTLE